MIGMMNCPTDNSVEVYHAPPARHAVFSRSLVKIFTGKKDRQPQITYAQDGRKFVNGSPVDRKEPVCPKLSWSRLLVHNNLQRKVSESAIPQPSALKTISEGEGSQESSPSPMRRRRSKSLGNCTRL